MCYNHPRRPHVYRYSSALAARRRPRHPLADVARPVGRTTRSLRTRPRQRVATEGWGARLLALQDPAGTWAKALYSPKWTSTTYSLLLLRHLGLPHDNPQARRGCELLLNTGFYRDGGINLFKSFKHSETCVTGMVLTLLGYFRLPDGRVHRIVEHLLGQQMADGGWNCDRPKGATHGSFHTTISVLEGLQEYTLAHPAGAEALGDRVTRAHEFLLIHRLYRSHRTGEVADEAMARQHLPAALALRLPARPGLFPMGGPPRDERMADAIEAAAEQTAPRWPLEAAPELARPRLLRDGKSGTAQPVEHADRPARAAMVGRAHERNG